MKTAVATTVTAEELHTKLASGARFEFWNVLTDQWFGGELIPGSRRVPLDQVGREISATRPDNDAEIVVYCSGPDCSQSDEAAQKLVTLGYRNVHRFEGGLKAWKDAGFPIEKIWRSRPEMRPARSR